jgi:hypothetical protein
MPKTILLLVFVVLSLSQASTSYGLPINLEDFESYANDEELMAVWKAKNSDDVWIFLDEWDGHESDKSMDGWYFYEPPDYCAEVDANLTALGAEPNWIGTGAKALSLWLKFSEIDPNAVMYIKLTDSSEPPQSAKVMYDGNLQELEGGWQECNFDLEEFVTANPSFDMSQVAQITIGFGDGNNVCYAVVLIDDIRLQDTRCVLSYRSSDFAKVDYAPLRLSGYGGGDCVVDEQELEIMANTFINWYPPIHPNSIPNLVAYWSMNEGAGNTILTDPYDPCYTGTFSASGVSWVTPGIIDTGSALHFDGSNGVRVNCGNENPASEANELTLAIWAKWAGTHLDKDKGQGLISKRREWSANGVMFMFEVDTYPAPRGTFGLRQFGLADTDVFAPTGLLTECTGEWVHLAATYDGTDSNDACKLYLNGNEVASGPFRFSGGTSAGLTIGNDVDAVGWPLGPESFKGDLDEVCIFNRALTAGEIAYLVGYVIEDSGVIAMPPPPANLYQECAGCPIVINFMDYAVLTEYWLQEQMWP